MKQKCAISRATYSATPSIKIKQFSFSPQFSLFGALRPHPRHPRASQRKINGPTLGFEKDTLPVGCFASPGPWDPCTWKSRKENWLFSVQLFPSFIPSVSHLGFLLLVLGLPKINGAKHPATLYLCDSRNSWVAARARKVRTGESGFPKFEMFGEIPLSCGKWD